MISFFASLFGYILNFLYEIVGNFGIAIIMFSILVKLIMLPISIKQQKTMEKSQKINNEMKQIQFKYKNDPEKMNQEMMSLYKREKLSPFSGCFSAIIQIVLLFSVFYLVRSPLTYMRKVDKGVIENLEKVVVTEENNKNAYKEISIINYINSLKNAESADIKENEKVEENTENKEQEKNQANEVANAENEGQESIQNKETESSEEKEQESTQNEEKDNTDNGEQENSPNDNNDFNINEHIDEAFVNMEFLGIDLSKVPTQDLGDFKVLIIPILYVISSFISIKISTSTTNNKNKDKLISDGKQSAQAEEYDPMAEANKSMSWFMPLMSISIACIAPLGLALYWLVNNILMIVERVILNKILKDNKEEAKNNA